MPPLVHMPAGLLFPEKESVSWSRGRRSAVRRPAMLLSDGELPAPQDLSARILVRLFGRPKRRAAAADVVLMS